MTTPNPSKGPERRKMVDPDYEDSWMNPEQSVLFTTPDYSRTPWTIERQKRIQGPITQWMPWSYHATKEERDYELERLQNEHPMWSLRAGFYRQLMAIL